VIGGSGATAPVQLDEGGHAGSASADTLDTVNVLDPADAAADSVV
jgi:hypothetical protein